MRVVNSLEAARRALADGDASLQSPPFAACHAGVHYYRALVDALIAEFPDHPFAFTLCCGDDAALAYDALSMGFVQVQCDCGDGQLQALQSVAAALDATVVRLRHG
jgi:hypothetical protein